MCRSGPQHPSAIRHLGELRLFWAVRDVDAPSEASEEFYLFHVELLLREDALIT